MWISEEKNIPLEEITDYVKLMTYILLTNFFSANFLCYHNDTNKRYCFTKKNCNCLKEIRLANWLTQNDVYYDLGIHIGRIESYKVDLSIITLNTVCNYFEITLVEFFKKVEKV